MTDKVLDFVGKRKESIEKKRRSFERILFNNFLGAYSVLDQGGTIYPISLVDISYDGCLFQIPWDHRHDKKLQVGSEINIRMYFTKQSFVPAVLKIRYGNEAIGKDGMTYMQYGCEFDKSMPSFEALQSFIDFLYKFAEHSAIDKGDTKVFFL